LCERRATTQKRNRYRKEQDPPRQRSHCSQITTKSTPRPHATPAKLVETNKGLRHILRAAVPRQQQPATNSQLILACLD
jgi:hypothetical protein